MTSKGGYILKKALIFVLALMGLVAWTNSAMADTTAVATNVDTNGTGPSAQIAVASNGVANVVLINGSNQKVYTNSSGSFSQLNGDITTNLDNKIVAVGLTGDDTVVVASVEKARTGLGSASVDTAVYVYMYNGATLVRQDILALKRQIANNGVGGGSDSAASIVSLAIVSSDTWVFVIVGLVGDTSPQSAEQDSGLLIMPYAHLDAAGNRSGTQLTKVVNDTIVIQSLGAHPMNLVAQVSPQTNENGDREGDTQVAVFVATKLVGDTANADSGIAIHKFYFDTNVGVRNVSTLRIGTRPRAGEIRDIGMVAENVNDTTYPRITVIAALSNASPVDSLVIWVINDTPQGLGGNNAIGTIQDTLVSVDTGLASIVGANGLTSIVLGRNGSSMGIVAATADTIFRATGSLSNRTITWSATTEANNAGYANSDTTHSSSFNGSHTELHSSFVNNTLYVAAYTELNRTVFYLSISLGEDSKKKDSAVCVMERMFGKTAVSALFPSMKSMRDGLMASSLGRKLVEVYYTF